MEFQFEPLEEFSWTREYPDGTSVLVGQYHPGMTYNCTKEPRHDALRDQCAAWEAEGKIRKIEMKGRKFITVKIGE